MIKYKAIITDMDGTLVPMSRDGIPSKAVHAAILKAKERVHVGIATGRPAHLVLPIAHSLGLHGPAVIHGGAQIIDLATGEVLTKQYVLPTDAAYVLEIATEEQIDLKIDSGEDEIPFTKDCLTQDIIGMFSAHVTEEAADRFQQRLAGHATLVTHKVRAWTEGKFQILISHTAATKLHGVFEVAKKLNIDTAEIIGIGDGGNDFPLLMACGFKVAMGNADDDLKAIADYIAPSVSEDGLAHVIEKFILS